MVKIMHIAFDVSDVIHGSEAAYAWHLMKKLDNFLKTVASVAFKGDKKNDKKSV